MENDKPIIPDAVKSQIRQYAEESARMGALHPSLLELMYDRQWFKYIVPKAYGGQGKSLVDMARLTEEICSVDGSAGWTVTACAGAGWFAKFIAPEIAKEFAARDLCIAGSGAPSGVARLQGDHYLVDGQWKYVTGAPHAAFFTMNCAMQSEDGKPLLKEDGAPQVSAFVFYKNEVSVVEDWRGAGLVATATHTIRVENAPVPANRLFNIGEQRIAGDYPESAYPFLQLAEATISVNVIGIAKHFIALAQTCFAEKLKAQRYSQAQFDAAQQKVCQAVGELQGARASFYEAFERSWAAVMRREGDSFPWADLSARCHRLARLSARAVNEIFPYCGMQAVDKESEMHRVWLDANVAGQHSLLAFDSGAGADAACN